MVEISVIIPVYNVEDYLKECLDSLCNQTFEDIEVICVDDGSTDNSLNILKEYENTDSRVKIITQKNSGASAARNNALNHVHGKYVYFIDSDDYLEPDALEIMHNLAEDRNLDLLIFKLVNFDDETGERDYDYSNMPFLLNIGREVFSYEDFKDDLLNVEVSPCTKFFKRDLIGDNRFVEGLIFEDNVFYIDYILDAERISFLDECLYNRRVRKHSVITRASKNYTDLIAIYDIIYQKFKDKGLYEEFREKLFMRKIDIIYYRFTLIQDKYRSQYFKEMKESFLNQKEEYEYALDLRQINDYYKNLFKSAIKAETPEELDFYLKITKLERRFNNLKKENRSLKKENRELKKTNRELLSSNSWKITRPLRKLMRR